MKFSASDLNEGNAYKLLSGAIVPRAIAWVSTIDKKGNFNLAPFSFFTAISTIPPTVGFSVGLRRGQKKDTLRNTEVSREFVINFVCQELVEKMNITAVDFPRGVDEFRVAGLTPLASDKVKPPRLAESPINLECKVLRILKIGQSGHRFIIGEILQFHFKDELVSDYKIDYCKLNILGRLAGSVYCKIDNLLEIQRLNLERYKNMDLKSPQCNASEVAEPFWNE